MGCAMQAKWGEAWALLEPLMPAAKALGRPRTTDLREVVNAIVYMLRERAVRPSPPGRQPLVHRRQEPRAHLTDLQKPWRRIRARAGLDDARIHDLRHSFASRALALGESLPMIGELLGHTQVQTTARYAHLANESVKASGSRVGDSIGLHIAGDG